jgi:hypothetical protein
MRRNTMMTTLPSPIWLLILLSLAGCTATIERRGKPEVEGRIISSDRRFVVVEVDERRYRVPGNEIKDIDHPGNGLLVAGVVFGGLALLMAESTALEDRANADGMAIIGLGLALGGAIPWVRSTGAADGYEDD